jgi:hypothetical protein
MAPPGTRLFDRRKFMWDGERFEAPPAAAAKKEEYEGQGFETQLVEEEGNWLLYTRRVVQEIVLEGEAPSA